MNGIGSDTGRAAGLPGGARVVRLPAHADGRGVLAVAERGGGLPFDARRAFWVYGVPPGARRGGHCHALCSELVFALAGGVSVELRDGAGRAATVRLGGPREGLLIPPGTWCELSDFAPGTVLAVLSDRPYEPGGYAGRPPGAGEGGARP